MANIDFTDINSITQEIQNLLVVPTPPVPDLPLPLILASATRAGLSAQAMGAEVVRMRAEAGLPVGPLPDGSVNPAEEMEIIRFQVLINNLTTIMRTAIAVLPGIPVTAYGTDATGAPVFVQGTTTGIGQGYAVVL